MTYTGQNVEHYAGDSRNLIVTVYDENGDILSLAGITSLTWKLYKLFSGTVYLTKTIGSGITITDAANGIFTISLSPADTQNLLGSYNHECELVDGSNNESTIFTGYFKIYATKT